MLSKLLDGVGQLFRAGLRGGGVGDEANRSESQKLGDVHGMRGCGAVCFWRTCRPLVDLSAFGQLWERGVFIERVGW